MVAIKLNYLMRKDLSSNPYQIKLVVFENKIPEQKRYALDYRN